MARQRTGEKVSIRPEVSILSVLKHLNYKPWFAVAEFVDNAIQSFLANRERIVAIDGPDAKLRVAIELDNSAEGRIVIRDNAAGISNADYARAFTDRRAKKVKLFLVESRDGVWRRSARKLARMAEVASGATETRRLVSA